LSQKDKGAIEALIEVSRMDCPITNYIKDVEEIISVDRLRIGETKTLHRIVCEGDPEKILPGLQKAAINVIRVGKNGFWAESHSCSACRFFAASNLAVLSSKAADTKRVLYRVLIQNPTRLKILEKDLEQAGLNPVILETELESVEILTEREKEVVNMAYTHGYFDPDRRISMTEIAKLMNVSTPSLSDVLRRATKKIVKYYMENKL
jgi:predicted DNA binding protein